VIPAALAALGIPEGTAVRPVSGGDIHQAARVDHAGGRVFIKFNERPTPGMFAREAEGLEALRGASERILVPAVLGFDEAWLALEWIERGAGGGAELGVGLAAIHRHTSPAFGWKSDNWIGSLPQPNAFLDDLPAFFSERRLQAQARGARIPASLRSVIDRLCDRLPSLLPQERPALLHGDLWGGNWMADAAGVPCIFDPAVHFGCREAELAFTRLFGGFPDAFYDAYTEAWPLQPGFDERVDLWNLYPLLVHANLFGGGYAASAERIARRYL
jgi:protein-ribulosamine 3-kinase